jgi:hypothetical protein
MTELRPPTREEIGDAVFQLKGIHLDELPPAELDQVLVEASYLLPEGVRHYCRDQALMRLIDTGSYKLVPPISDKTRAAMSNLIETGTPAVVSMDEIGPESEFGRRVSVLFWSEYRTVLSEYVNPRMAGKVQ